MRDQAREFGLGEVGATEIAYPGLAEPESQIALPVLDGNRLLGVLFAESSEPMRFCYEDEDALALVADRLAMQIATIKPEDTAAPAVVEGSNRSADSGEAAIRVRHYAADDSVFLGHDYLIKGVAGAIFWKLACAHVQEGRVEFSNRELRLDPTLRLPEHAENLEARLVLLERRLRERGGTIHIEKCGRGRFRLDVPVPLVLEDVAA